MPVEMATVVCTRCYLKLEGAQSKTRNRDDLSRQAKGDTDPGKSLGLGYCSGCRWTDPTKVVAGRKQAASLLVSRSHQQRADADKQKATRCATFDDLSLLQQAMWRLDEAGGGGGGGGGSGKTQRPRVTSRREKEKEKAVGRGAGDVGLGDAGGGGGWANLQKLAVSMGGGGGGGAVSQNAKLGLDWALQMLNKKK